MSFDIIEKKHKYLKETYDFMRGKGFPEALELDLAPVDRFNIVKLAKIRLVGDV